MVRIIVDDFAYRILNSGIVECSKVTKTLDQEKETVSFNNSEFGYASPEERNMDGGQDSYVRQFLMALTTLCPPNRDAMPSAMPTNARVGQDPNSEMGRP